MKLSKNFTLQEFILSTTAERLGIENIPTDIAVENMKLLAERILQPLREDLGRPIHINSGYRCLELNRALKSKDTSQHLAGQAADITAYNYDTLQLAEYIRDHYIFDQLILEFWTPDQNNGWVHVSYDSEYNRGECLTINRNGTFYGLGEE